MFYLILGNPFILYLYVSFLSYFVFSLLHYFFGILPYVSFLQQSFVFLGYWLSHCFYFFLASQLYTQFFIVFIFCFTYTLFLFLHIILTKYYFSELFIYQFTVRLGVPYFVYFDSFWSLIFSDDIPFSSFGLILIFNSFLPYLGLDNWELYYYWRLSWF